MPRIPPSYETNVERLSTVEPIALVILNSLRNPKTAIQVQEDTQIPSASLYRIMGIMRSIGLIQEIGRVSVQAQMPGKIYPSGGHLRRRSTKEEVDRIEVERSKALGGATRRVSVYLSAIRYEANLLPQALVESSADDPWALQKTISKKRQEFYRRDVEVPISRNL